MKICPVCGFHSEDDAQICNNCGETYNMSESVEIQSQSDVSAKDISTSDSLKKRNKKVFLVVLITAVILLICMVSLFILDAIGIISVGDISQSESNSEAVDIDENNLSSEDNLSKDEDVGEGSAENCVGDFLEETTERTAENSEEKLPWNSTEEISETTVQESVAESAASKTGIFSDNIYKNEWAGVTVKIPSGFYANTTAAQQLKNSVGITDAFVCADSSGSSILFALYDYTGDSLSQESILKMYVDSQVKNYESIGAEVTIGQSYQKTIRSYTYTCVDSEIDYGGNIYCMKFRVGNYEGHIAMFVFIGDSQKTCDKLEAVVLLP